MVRKLGVYKVWLDHKDGMFNYHECKQLSIHGYHTESFQMRIIVHEIDNPEDEQVWLKELQEHNDKSGYKYIISYLFYYEQACTLLKNI